jgi:hypothetical protein
MINEGIRGKLDINILLKLLENIESFGMRARFKK